MHNAVSEWPQVQEQLVRSTWLTSSREALRRHGHFAAYMRCLPAEYHEPLRDSLAAAWLPARFAQAHYQACDELGLTGQQQFEMGNEVGAFAHRSYIAFALQAAREAGVTPWTVLEALPKLWTRMWRGAELTTRKLGRKDARVDIRGWLLGPIPYIRVGSRGIITAVTQPLSVKTYVSEIKGPEGRDVSFRVAWV